MKNARNYENQIMARSRKYFLHKNICSYEATQRRATHRTQATSARRRDRLTFFSNNTTTNYSTPYTSAFNAYTYCCNCHGSYWHSNVCRLLVPHRWRSRRCCSWDCGRLQQICTCALVAAALIYACNEKVARRQRVFKYTVWQVAHLVTATTTSKKRKSRRVGK